MEIQRILETMNSEDKALLVCGEGDSSTRAIRLLPALFFEHDGFKRGDGVCFPSAAAIASSWDADLAYGVGREIGRDCCARGVHVTARVPEVGRAEPLSGRRYRQLSTDALLSSVLAGAYIDGVQSTGVGACVRVKSADVLQPPKSKAVSLERGDFALAESLRENGYEGTIVSGRGEVDARAAALKAGIDLSLGSGFDEAADIAAALKDGRLKEEELGRSALSVLKLIDETYDDHEYDYDEEGARNRSVRFAAECAVLLKNDGALPLSGDSVTFIGDEDICASGEEGGEEKRSSLSAAFKADRRVKAVKCGGHEDLTERALEETYPDETVVVILQNADCDCFGIERETALPEEKLRLVERLSESGREVVALAVGGGSLDLKRLKCAAAVMYLPYLGDGAGAALKRLLCGELSPCGRLAEDFFGADGEVVYPLGHGLTYTEFEYGKPRKVSAGITLEIKNVGRYPSAETVQVYMGGRLAAFAKVRLKGGEVRGVTLPVDTNAGAVEIGASRTDIRRRFGDETRKDGEEGSAREEVGETPEEKGEPDMYSTLSDIAETAGGKKLLKKVRKLALDSVGGNERRAERLLAASCGIPLYRLIGLSGGEIDVKFVESCLANKDGIVGAIMRKVGITPKKSDGAQ